jgi:hypothetical protein
VGRRNTESDDTVTSLTSSATSFAAVIAPSAPTQRNQPSLVHVVMPWARLNRKGWIMSIVGFCQSNVCSLGLTAKVVDC